MRFLLAALVFGITAFSVGCSPSVKAAPLDQKLPVPTPATNPMPSRSSAEINSCLVSVCGPANTNNSAYDTDYAEAPKSPLFKKLWKENFDTLAREAVQAETELNASLHSAYNEINASATLDQEQNQESAQAYIAASIIFERIARTNNTFISITNSGPQIDYKVLSEQFDNNPLLQEPAKRLADKIFLPMLVASSKSKSSPSDLLALRLTYAFEGEPADEALKKDAAETLRRLESVRALFGRSILESLDLGEGVQAIFKKAARGDSLNKSEGNLYGERAMGLEILEFVDRLENRQIFANTVGNLKDYLKLVIQKLPIEKLLPATDEYSARVGSRVCEQQFGRTLKLTHKARSHAVESLTAIKSAAKSLAESYIQEPRQLEWFRSAVDSIHHSFVDPSSVRLHMLKIYLRDRIDGSKYLNRVLTERSAGWRTSALFELLTRSTQALYQSTNGRVDVKKTCETLADMKPSDGAGFNNQLIISAFTAINREITIPILAHEVGHVMSGWLRQLTLNGSPNPIFDKQLTCIGNRNPFVKEAKSLSGSLNTQWSEEDLADKFSTELIRKLKANNHVFAAGPKPLGCVMVMDSGDEYENLTKLEPALGDTHSSGLLRLLFGIHDSGIVTPECKPFLDDISRTGRQLRCEI